MAPTKRARPAFSPPRPRKQKSTTAAAKSTASTTTNKKSRKTDTPKPSKSKPDLTSETRRRSRLVSPTPSASDSQDENEDADQNSEDEPHDDNTTSSPNPPNPDLRESHPDSEPDYILAEITHSPPATSTPTIPTPLLHRILQSHFSHPNETKISTDAREMAGRYIDVFVREAVMRCAYEKGEKGGGAGQGDGWLEVEDLERVAVQLCLDF